jgi:hypothetical protein
VRLAGETEDVPLRASQQLSQLGDPVALRGVPVVGGRGGYGGAIRGTRPSDGLYRKFSGAATSQPSDHRDLAARRGAM